MSWGSKTVSKTALKGKSTNKIRSGQAMATTRSGGVGSGDTGRWARDHAALAEMRTPPYGELNGGSGAPYILAPVWLATVPHPPARLTMATTPTTRHTMHGPFDDRGNIASSIVGSMRER
jgi:hypothetical protein